MILDVISNLNVYENCNKNFNKVIEFMKKNDLTNLESGRYELEDDCFVKIMSYQTKEQNDAQLESHKNYIDVQYIISGNEKVLWQNANVGMKAEEYNEKEDCLLWKVSNPVSFCINAGMFCVFFPDDLHCASLSDGKLVNVKKAVFKIAIN